MTELRPIAQHSRDTILDTPQLAAAFGCSEATVERSDFPVFYIGEGKKMARFHWGSVCDECARRSRRLARAG